MLQPTPRPGKPRRPPSLSQEILELFRTDGRRFSYTLHYETVAEMLHRPKRKVGHRCAFLTNSKAPTRRLVWVEPGVYRLPLEVA